MAKASESELVTVQTRLDFETYERVEKLAEMGFRSIAAELRMLIEKGIQTETRKGQ